jgi:CheY-like chemotaxis protein
MDGYEVARRLRTAFGRELLLVAVTAECGPDVDRRTTEAGFDLRFAKPADPAELVRALSGRPGGHSSVGHS